MHHHPVNLEEGLGVETHPTGMMSSRKKASLKRKRKKKRLMTMRWKE